MGLNSMLNLFVGMALTFGAVALLASTVTEAISTAVGWRSATLVAGIQLLLNDPELTGLAKEVLTHAAVNPLSSGKALPKRRGDGQKLDIRPAYVSAPGFAGALIDAVRVLPKDVDQTRPMLLSAAQWQDGLKTGIDQIADPQIKAMLAGAYNRAEGDVATMKHEIAGWFDAAMDRVSGRYKRNAMACSFIVAFAVAGSMNIDAIRTAQALWADPHMTDTITASTASTADPLHRYLGSFPYGWGNCPGSDPGAVLACKYNGWGWLERLVGWLMSAAAALFGAPFWFDMLQKLVRLRGTGQDEDRRDKKGLLF